MRVIDGLENLSQPLERPVISVGNFDGVHLGHQSLLAKVVERTQAIDGTAVAVTFHPHPIRVLNSAGGPPLLTVKARKEELIEAQGMDVLVNIFFTRRFAALTAGEFIEKILVGKLGLKELVVGYDASFGSDRQGGSDFISQIARKLDFTVHFMDPVKVDDKPVSSTWARDLIESGQVSEARRLLGRPYQVFGRVIRGDDRGEKLLGFPTANLDLVSEVIPARGVYAVRVRLEDGSVYQGVTNIGFNPTFDGHKLSVESFLLDFDQVIYGQFIRLDFIERLRDEIKFDGSEMLKKQIEADVAAAREIFT